MSDSTENAQKEVIECKHHKNGNLEYIDVTTVAVGHSKGHLNIDNFQTGLEVINFEQNPKDIHFKNFNDCKGGADECPTSEILTTSGFSYLILWLPIFEQSEKAEDILDQLLTHITVMFIDSKKPNNTFTDHNVHNETYHSIIHQNDDEQIATTKKQIASFKKSKKYSSKNSVLGYELKFLFTQKGGKNKIPWKSAHLKLVIGNGQQYIGIVEIDSTDKPPGTKKTTIFIIAAGVLSVGIFIILIFILGKRKKKKDEKKDILEVDPLIKPMIPQNGGTMSHGTCFPCKLKSAR